MRFADANKEKPMTTERMIELLEIERQCVLRSANCNRNCTVCNLVQEDKELLEMYEGVINLLKEQK